MEEQDIKIMANKLISIFLKNYSFWFMNRKKTLWLHNGIDKKIYLTKYSIWQKESEIKEVLLHEIAHWLDYEFRWQSKHDESFRGILSSIWWKFIRSKWNISWCNDYKYIVKCNSCWYAYYRHKKTKREKSCWRCSNIFDRRFLLTYYELK